MTETKFADAATLAGTRMTNDGYMVAEVRCARTGCQDYLASEMGVDGDVITVYRPPEVVFDKASMATFAGKPVTIGHPSDPVTAENWKSLAVGDIGEDIARDGEFIRVPIKLMDAAAIEAVMSGTREISMGYSTGIEFRDGTAPDGTPYQAVQVGPIRINHLAIVPHARGGSKLRIGDGAGQWGASPLNNREDAHMADNAIKTRTVMIDGLSVETTDAGAQALEKLKSDISDAANAHKAEIADRDKTIAAKDAEIATKDAKIKDLESKILDAAAIDKLVKDRADFVAKVRAIDPETVTDGKSQAEVMKAVVIAKRGAEMADKSDAYIEAAFDILASDVKTDDAAKVLAGGTTVKVGDRDKLYADRDREIADAWKTPKKKEA